MNLDDVREAAGRLQGITIRTPLLPLDESLADSIWIKPETLQPIHSFKLRGVFNAVASMTPDERSGGLSTVSAGNTAQALGWAGRHFGVPARSVMPDSAPATKVEAFRRYGGEPVLRPVAEIFRFLREHEWEREPYAFVHPWTDPRLHAGHATLALELVEDFPDLDTVFVPVGGGGLLGGVGPALRELAPSVRIVAVEPSGCPSFHAALQAGHPVDVECSTLCDGVAVPYITEEMFPVLSAATDESVLVSEDDVKRSMRLLVEANRLVAEGSGALALAAALSMPFSRRGVSVCLLTGGSVDPGKLASILGDQPDNQPA